jgi:hypothetical protein
MSFSPTAEFVCYATGTLVALFFVLLLVRTAKVRQVLQEVQSKRFSDPEDMIDAPDVARVVKAYSVTADCDVAASLGSNAGSLREETRTVCGSQSKTRTQVVEYNDVHWLALRRSSGTDELHDDVVAGRVKYAAIGGAVVRIAAMGNDSSVSAATTEREGNVRLFRIAAAYDATSIDDPNCSPSGLLPIATDPVRLWRTLSDVQRPLIGLLIWGWV